MNKKALSIAKTSLVLGSGLVTAAGLTKASIMLIDTMIANDINFVIAGLTTIAAAGSTALLSVAAMLGVGKAIASKAVTKRSPTQTISLEHE